MNETLREILGWLYPFFAVSGAVFWTALIGYGLLLWLMDRDFIKREEQ